MVLLRGVCFTIIMSRASLYEDTRGVERVNREYGVEKETRKKRKMIKGFD